MSAETRARTARRTIEPGPASSPAGPEGVRADQRWFGLDRTSVKPALIVLVIALFLIYGWQGLNSAVPWNNPVRAGDVLDLGDGATAVPPVGWQLESGAVVGGTGRAGAATLASGGTTVSLRVVSFTGTAAGLLDKVRRAPGDGKGLVDGPAQTVTTTSGLVGVVQESTSPSRDQVRAAFKLSGGSSEQVDAAPGLLVEVRSVSDQYEQDRAAVTDLLRSVSAAAQ